MTHTNFLIVTCHTVTLSSNLGPSSFFSSKQILCTRTKPPLFSFLPRQSVCSSESQCKRRLSKNKKHVSFVFTLSLHWLSLKSTIFAKRTSKLLITWQTYKKAIKQR